MIELLDLHKQYKNGAYALKGINFSFDKGILGLIGPNGAGKSTLIKILVGLLRPTKGKGLIMGGDAFSNTDLLKHVGVLQEKPAYPPDVSGRDFLSFMTIFKELEEDSVEETCKTVGITNYVDQKIGSYSAGMLQKFGIADAIIGNPSLVILDEPTSNLDPLGRIEVLDIIGALHRRGMNFIVSTHILSELGRVCTDILILNEGRVIAEGSLDELGRVSENEKVTDLEKLFMRYLREDGK